MSNERCINVTITAVLLLVLTVSVARAQAPDPPFARALFTQLDAVQAFDLATGKGIQVGTVTGIIAGTSYVETQVVVTGPPVGDGVPVAFTNKVVITDVEGDQVFFDNNGTGTFYVGLPASAFKGWGGPQTGTYVVTGATGKYQSHAPRYRRWAVGTTYRSRAILVNPPSAGVLGSVYVEVSRDNRR